MPACSLTIVCALSASFQKSGLEASWFSSSRRFFLRSKAKTPPELVEPLLEAGELGLGLFEHKGEFLKPLYYSSAAPRFPQTAPAIFFSSARMTRASWRERSWS